MARSKSQFVCFRCGLAVHGWRDGWKHSVAGQQGRTPRHMRHEPQPIPRDEYERFVAPDTPLDEARAIAQRYQKGSSQ